MNLEKADDFDMAVHDMIKKYLTEHQRIIFNGNGYSEEWVAEAERRGLPNIKSMVDSVASSTDREACKAVRKVPYLHKGRAGIPCRGPL